MANLEPNPDNVIDTEKSTLPIMRGDARMARGAGFFEVPIFSHVIDGLWQGCSPAEFPDIMEQYEYDIHRTPYAALLKIERQTRNSQAVDCHWLWEEGKEKRVHDGIFEHMARERSPRFGAILNLYPWAKYVVPDDVTYEEVELYDSADLPDKAQIDTLALGVGLAVKVGIKVLVHCQAGLNRSSLVVARALMLGWDMTADQAIDHVRGSRSPVCLCNETFENWLRAL